MLRIKTIFGEICASAQIEPNYYNLVVEAEGPASELIEKTESELSKFPLSTSYKDFIQCLKAESDERNLNQYLFYIDTGVLYLFRRYSLVSNSNSLFQLILKYQFESIELEKYYREILKVTDDHPYVFILSNHLNYYCVIAPWQILDVILTRKVIELSGGTAFLTYKHKSSNGKIREITAPHEAIKKSLQELNGVLQAAYDKRNKKFQVAYKKGHNVLSGAMLHKTDKYVYNLDIHDFYPSCKKELVKKYTDFLFAYTYNRKFIEEEFLNTITINDGLFIGSPISGTLANAIISVPVQYMNNICKKKNIAVSVYADDISFSSNKRISKKYAELIFHEAFSRYQLDGYFILNEKKSVGFTGCHRKITGVSINENNQLTVPGKYYKKLRSEIEHLAHNKSEVNIQKLRGQIAYGIMVDETGKLYRYLKKFEPTISQYKLVSSENMEKMKIKFEEGGEKNGTEC